VAVEWVVQYRISDPKKFLFDVGSDPRIFTNYGNAMRANAARQALRQAMFAGPDHPHEAQNPEVLDIGSMNRKNKVGN
jgi:hypothetical protein